MTTRYLCICLAGLLCISCQLAPTEPTANPDTPSTKPFPQVTTPAEVLEPEVAVVEAEPEKTTESVVVDELPQPIELRVEEAESEQSLPAPETFVAAEPEDGTLGNVAKSTTKSLEVAVELCRELGEKLSSVNESECLQQQLLAHEAQSVLGRALAIKNYGPTDSREPLGKVLVIGGIHGDEFSSVSVVFKWMEILRIHHSGVFDWRFIPVGNPDGLLRTESQRQNANGVDLNRNFPTSDWNTNAREYWINKTDKRARRYPGEFSNSEPETQWLVSQIEHFKPDVIVSMHAPYHLVDYDGPPSAPDQLGSLYLRRLGVYPGSLGNYAGVDLNIPVVTVELASAGIMPSEREISAMWDDLVGWLRTKLGDEHAQPH